MKRASTRRGFVICVENANYPASLELWKVYRVVSDRDATTHGLIRVIDESGEDYLYSSEHFRPIELPEKVRRLYRAKSAVR
jgi:hypothetical protein